MVKKWREWQATSETTYYLKACKILITNFFFVLLPIMLYTNWHLTSWYCLLSLKSRAVWKLPDTVNLSFNQTNIIDTRFTLSSRFIAEDHYFIWPILFVTSRLYSNSPEGDRQYACDQILSLYRYLGICNIAYILRCQNVPNSNQYTCIRTLVHRLKYKWPYSLRQQCTNTRRIRLEARSDYFSW